MVAQPPRKCCVCLCTGRSENSSLEVCAACGGSGWEGVMQRRGQNE
jgi:hypothetical protein